LGELLDLGRSRCQVVAIVGQVRHVSLELEPRPRVYLPLQFVASPGSQQAFAVLVRDTGDRSTGSGESIIGLPLQFAIVERLESFDSLVRRSFARRRLLVRLTALSAVSSAILAMTTVLGVFSWEFTRRRSELALRFSLGESSFELVARMAKRILTVTILAMLVAVVLCASFSGVVQGALIGVDAADPVAAGLALVALTIAVGVGAGIVLWRARRFVSNDQARNREL
jgi:hypothetical protein